jgi:hypothetical protein
LAPGGPFSGLSFAHPSGGASDRNVRIAECFGRAVAVVTRRLYDADVHVSHVHSSWPRIPPTTERDAVLIVAGAFDSDGPADLALWLLDP